MASFLLYIIKWGLCLILFYTGYKLLLSKETFFRFNRTILLSGIMACMLIPLIKIKTESPSFIQHSINQLENKMIEGKRDYASTFEVKSASKPYDQPNHPIAPIFIIALVYMIGFIVTACLLIRSYISLFLFIRKGEKIKQGNFTIVLFDKPVTPCNYGRYILISAKDYAEHQEPILTHELAHFHFLHSFDTLMMELLTLVQWFNPVVKALKNEVRQIHEYQADAEVLKTGIDATKYQLLLMKRAVSARPFAFANSLNNNKLKIRFIMMTKKKSNSWARLKLLLLIPVAALSVYVFASPEGKQRPEQINASKITATPSIIQNVPSDIVLPADSTKKVIYITVDNKIDSINGKHIVLISLQVKADSVFRVSIFGNKDATDHESTLRIIKDLMAGLNVEEKRNTSVSIKMDSNTDIAIINAIKDILRQALLFKVDYSSN